MHSTLVRPLRVFAAVSDEYRGMLETIRRPAGRTEARSRDLHFPATAAEAREEWRRAGEGGPSPELVLIDLKFADGEGRELLREWKRHPQLQRIPVIAIVDEADDALTNAVYDARANCLLVLPTDEEARRATFGFLETFWLSLAQLPSDERRF